MRRSRVPGLRARRVRAPRPHQSWHWPPRPWPGSPMGHKTAAAPTQTGPINSSSIGHHPQEHPSQLLPFILLLPQTSVRESRWAAPADIVQTTALTPAKDTASDNAPQASHPPQSHPMHILLIEDDLDLGRALQSALKVEGLTSEWLRRTVDAPATVDATTIDCVLLDLTLPDGSGFDLLARWRAQGEQVPIIVITARSAVEDRLAGLDGGADDFVVKPFATAELLSRIRAVLRRSARQASERWVLGESRGEFQLLLGLAREPGVVVSKSLLSQRLDPLGEPVDFGAIEVHVSNLRRKIGAELIRTVRGVGYLLQP